MQRDCGPYPAQIALPSAADNVATVGSVVVNTRPCGGNNFYKFSVPKHALVPAGASLPVLVGACKTHCSYSVRNIWCYSARKATAGLTRTARRAGIKHARNPANARAI